MIALRMYAKFVGNWEYCGVAGVSNVALVKLEATPYQENSMKILLIQTSFLGDVVLSSPLIGSLRKLYPQAEIWFLTTPGGSELVRRDPELAGCLVYDKRGDHRGLFGILKMIREIRALKCDRIYSLHRSLRTALIVAFSGVKTRVGFQEARGGWAYTRKLPRTGLGHEVVRNLALLKDEESGITRDQELRLFAPAEREVGFATLQALKAAKGRYVVLAPGSAWYTKMWHWSNYRNAAQRLLQQGLDVVIIGAGKEQKVAEKVAEGLGVINVAGRTSLADILWIISRAAGVVCNDSVALHIASAFKVPTVAVFCATTPNYGFGPWRNRALVIERDDLACKPCSRHGGQRCPLETETCMKELSADKVVSALQSIIV